MVSISRLLFALMGIALSTCAALAQSPPAKGAAAPAAPAEDPLGRTTPHGTVVNFISTVGRGDMAQAAQYLGGGLGSKSKAELALQLKNLMDKGLKADLNFLSKSPGGDTGDGLPLNRELVGKIKIGEYSLEVLLDRVQQGKNPPIWLFAAETLLNLRELPSERPQRPWLEQHLPATLVENSLGGVALYRLVWVPLILLVMAAIAWVAAGLLSPVVRRILRPASQRADFPNTSYLGPIRLLLFAFLMWPAAQLSGTLMTRQYWTHIAVLLVALGVGWLFMRAIDPVAFGYVDYLNRTRQRHRIALIHLCRGLAKVIVVVTALLVVLSLEGVNITAAIAGIGIGGLALAFAAQKTLENVFGTVMLVADQPIRVGDTCRLGDTVGVIEDIGLRSTRVRTSERTIVTVPNGQASSMVVENLTARDKMWFRHVVGLRYETTSGQMRQVLANVRKLLSGHAQVETDSVRVRFVKLGASSLDLEICAYVLATDPDVFTAIQEELLLGIMETVEASGTTMAFPSQTTYVVAKDPGPAAKSEVAIAGFRQTKDGQAHAAADAVARAQS